MQISALPISHDNSADAAALSAFGPGGFSDLNEAYFDRACEMLELAVRYGFTPSIHLLWVNYIPDTWAGSMPTGTPMPLRDALTAVTYMVRRFKPYAPIYSISGDTKFETERVTDYYDKAIDAVRAIDPDALLTLHLAPHADVPNRLCGKIDFYTYQGGHTAGAELENHYRFGLHYYQKPGEKPVVNSEPPYEGHGHGHSDGRHDERSLRCAAWQSLLSGASAGVTYGAHGLWSMHRAGQAFTNLAFSNSPFDWRTALRLPGAWEMASARALFETHNLFGLGPCGLLDEKYPSIRMARPTIFPPSPSTRPSPVTCTSRCPWKAMMSGSMISPPCIGCTRKSSPPGKTAQPSSCRKSMPTFCTLRRNKEEPNAHRKKV